MVLWTAPLIPLLAGTAVVYKWPNFVMDELEHILVDTNGFNDAGFKASITPCTNYVSGLQTAGRETAAQWIRVGFHDFTTANVAAGTGGLDASIGFETDRAENSGSAMNDSMSFFAPFVNPQVSMADLIALSVVLAVGSCSGSKIPLRGGRIDATGGGDFGAPAPETSLTDTLAQFAKAGFNQSEAIALTACGHTMGSVHHDGFPQVVPESAVTAQSTTGAASFDSTPQAFDVALVNEYLEGTGKRGGPLVTTTNVTVQSDLRIYASDNNATMRSLAKSSTYFEGQCSTLFEKMLNTVPSTVRLTEVISPMAVKPVNVAFEIDPTTGAAQYSGYIRLLSTSFDKDAVVSLTFLSRAGKLVPTYNTTATSSETGTSIFGTTFYHKFSTTIDPSVGVSSFTITVKDRSKTSHFTNGGGGYPIQDKVVWIPELSSVSTTSMTVTAAVLTSLGYQDVSVAVHSAVSQQGTQSPKINHLPLVSISGGTTSVAGLYTIYTATIPVELPLVRQSSIDILATLSNGWVSKDEFRKLTSVVYA